MYRSLLLLLGISLAHFGFAQINPDRITIARDAFGVPHIHAPTDPEVAYGFAWATAEDDFATMQRQLLIGRNRLAEVDGVAAAPIDILVQFLELDKRIDAEYESQVSPKFKKVIEGYCQGVNAFAVAHPDEILLKGIFPVNPKDMLKSYCLGMILLSDTPRNLQKILNGDIAYFESQLPKGSNAIAISKNRTKEGETFLAINSHQPLEGLNSWYEAHLVSDEGWNMLGATFVGGVTLFLGVNEYLGWAHTVNRPDFTDVYKLTMHPSKKGLYKFDGEWKTLVKKKAKAKVKLGFFKLGIKRTFYESEYGLTLKNKQGYYSLRYASAGNITAAEQWYRMNKATNFEEFRGALEMLGINNTHIIYADREDNIFYVSNGLFPKRNPDYDWRKVLPGDTSATRWKRDYYPFDSLAQVLNPSSGYVYNTNHSPFLATDAENNIPLKKINPTMGYQHVSNNRSLRLRELIESYESFSYDDFKEIKYDITYPDSLYHFTMVNLDDIKRLDDKKYPDLAGILTHLRNWDHQTDTKSIGATIFILTIRKLNKMVNKANEDHPGNEVSETQMVEALRFTQKHLVKHFGIIDVPLGIIQRHTRGEVDLPVSGGPEILAATYGDLQKDGRMRNVAGDSYIELVRFTKDGVKIESVNAFGASARPESPHYTDQMQLYVDHKTKPMTLDWEDVLKNAKSVYHPK